MKPLVDVRRKMVQSPFFLMPNPFSALRRKWQVVRFFNFTENSNLLWSARKREEGTFLKAVELRENKVVIKKT